MKTEGNVGTYIVTGGPRSSGVQDREDLGEALLLHGESRWFPCGRRAAFCQPDSYDPERDFIH